MRKIFISYRRSDGEYAAGALGRELRNYFGEDQVFRDKEDVAGGVAWKQHLLHEIDRDSAMLVLIGREWLNVKDAQGRRRLDNPDDPLRLEIADGLKDGAAIFPVLLENARMPEETELPPDLQRLAELNALSLRDSDWAYDIGKIRKTLERVGFAPVAAAAPTATGRSQAAPPQNAKAVSVKGIIGAVIVVVAFAALGSDDLGNDGRLGVGILAAVSFALGIVSWRETRNTGSGWRFLGIAVSTLAVLAGFGIIGDKAQESERARNSGGVSSQTTTPTGTRGSNSAAADPSTETNSRTADGQSVLSLLRGHALVRFNPETWKRRNDPSLEAGEYLLVHSGGDLYVKLITERMPLGTENLANLGLTNAKNVDAAATVTRRGTRQINGLTVAFREIELTVNGVAVTYYAHYFSDAAGSIQIVGYTSRQLMNEYRGAVEEFVAGLNVPKPTE